MIPHSICEQSGVHYVKSPFVLERPGLAAAYIYMLVEGIVFYAITLLIEVFCEVLLP